MSANDWTPARLVAYIEHRIAEKQAEAKALEAEVGALYEVLHLARNVAEQAEGKA